MTDLTTPAGTTLEPAIPAQRVPETDLTRIRSVPERAQRGKVARQRLPLEAHAHVPEEEVDAVALVSARDPLRVPELLPIRYGRMLASPFAFYRGSAAVMAADLASLPHSGLHAQLCGDAHLSNFGVYASPERRLVFDVNDFDETLPGPFEWDVKRLAASIELAGRANGHKRRERREEVVSTVAQYRTAMRRFAKMSNLAVWYASLDIDQAVSEFASRVSASDRRRAQANLDKARGRDSRQAAAKLTRSVDGATRFVNDPPLVVPLVDLLPEMQASVVQERLGEIVQSYRSTLDDDRRMLLDQFQLVDIARKVVGVGSVGTRAWVLLLTGRDEHDMLVLQAKEAAESVLEPYVGRSEFEMAGHRVVAGQRLVQAVSDIFLGWTRNTEPDGTVRDFYVRQLRDGKGSAVVEEMDPRRLTVYGELCAWTLARAHARSGDRVAIAAYLGKKPVFEHAVAEFAAEYADRAERQWGQLDAAVAHGTVAATPGI